MRVPISISILLALLVLGGTWWWNTREMDFLTPPSEAKLAAIRAQVLSTVPEDPIIPPVAETPDQPNGETPAEESLPETEPVPEIELGDIDSAPGLPAYQNIATQGAAHMLALSKLLASKGQFERSLLALERILDSTNPDPIQASEAIESIRQLRPTLPDWNIDPNGVIPIVLHAHTSRELESSIKPALDQLAKQIERASSGILKAEIDLTTGKPAAANAAALVAIHLSGPAKNNVSTEVLSFTADDSSEMTADLAKSVYRLVNNLLQRTTTLSPLLPLSEGDDPLDAMQFKITRLAWKNVGMALASTAE